VLREPFLADTDLTLYQGDVLLVAWAAGLFEGEGCITTGSPPSYGLMLTLSMTDEDVVLRFREAVGAGRVTPRTRNNAPKHWKDIWSWYACGEPAEAVLDLLLPFLGQRRSARAQEVREFRRAGIESATAERECPTCHAKFRPRFSSGSRRQKFCSDACCQAANSRKVAKEEATRSRVCPVCGASFCPVYSKGAKRRRFCTPTCRQREHYWREVGQIALFNKARLGPKKCST
jgi:hypothetical protein